MVSKRASPSSRVTAPSAVADDGHAVEPPLHRPGELAGDGRVVVGQDRDPEVRRARRRSGHVLEVLAIENDTSGGSRLTDVNELAASPTGTPSTLAATATTPLGKIPNASRRRSGSRSWLVRNVVTPSPFRPRRTS